MAYDSTVHMSYNMHCNLPKLPVELMLMVIRELHQDEDIEAHATYDDEKITTVTKRITMNPS